MSGKERSSPCVYGCCGSRNTSSAGPYSAIFPPYMIATLLHVCAMTERSWEIRIIDRSSSFCSFVRSSRIWAWIMTSRAVTGSSAMMIFGRQARAIAIITRWRIPPENSCGYSSFLAGLIPTSSRSSTTRPCASSKDMLSCNAIASAICQLTRLTGLRAFIAPWKTIAMCFQRIFRISDSLIVARSFPEYRMWPSTIRPFFGSRRMIDSAVVVFPQPLSPASPRLSPFSSVHETSSTARTVPERVSKYVLRWSTSMRAVHSPLTQFRVQDLVQGVAEEREAQDDSDEREPRHHDPRPVSVDDRTARLRLVEDDPPTQGADLDLAQEGKGALRQDGDRDRQDRIREHEREDIREDMLSKNRCAACARSPGSLDEDPFLDA